MGHGTEQHLEHAEHAQHHAVNPFDRRVAMSMAILAAILAGVTMLSHRGHTETLRLATEATQYHTKESDAWNYYQAKNIISAEYEAQLAVLPLLAGSEASATARKKAAAFLTGVLNKYKGEPGADGKRPKGQGQLGKLQEQAEALKAKGEEATAKSHHIHAAVNWIDYGHLALDLALVFCTVALLTKLRGFWLAGLLVGVAGAAVAGFGIYQWLLTSPAAHAVH
jgi:hypothetical protein